MRNFFILGDPLTELKGRYEPIGLLLYIYILKCGSMNYKKSIALCADMKTSVLDGFVYKPQTTAAFWAFCVKIESQRENVEYPSGSYMKQT
jgi:hypothetical protein